ncbi:MAG: nucleoid-associated protein YejK [Glaciecola sp.]|nr:nucleoid-associated protein YejK [Glaciecola sp.]MDG1814983.1 nucleoid-associated protein YejK [Glaciecola sp.]
MSAIIKHFVMHQLAINSEQRLTLTPKNACFDIGPSTEALAHEINQAFNTKPGKGVGGFASIEVLQAAVEGELTDSDDSDISDEDSVATENATAVNSGPRFKELLGATIKDAEHFIELSKGGSQLLIKALVEDGLVETGYIVFVHYEFLATEYLLIALLNTKQHVEVTDELELSYSDHLDVPKMQLAVRIDLTQYTTQPELNRYISFIKGRMGRKVSDFFMRFVGCEEKVDVKAQNKQLIAQVDDYLATEQLSTEEKQVSRGVVADYYKQKIASGEDINVSELAAKLPKNEEQQSDFRVFNAHLEQPLEPQFQPDRAALKPLAKFSGQGGGVTLSFDRNLLGDKVHYDPVTDTLVIKGIPPNLKDQLSKADND